MTRLQTDDPLGKEEILMKIKDDLEIWFLMQSGRKSRFGVAFAVAVVGL